MANDKQRRRRRAWAVVGGISAVLLSEAVPAHASNAGETVRIEPRTSPVSTVDACDYAIPCDGQPIFMSAVTVYGVSENCVPGKHYTVVVAAAQDGALLDPAPLPKGASDPWPCVDGSPVRFSRTFLDDDVHAGQAGVAASLERRSADWSVYDGEVAVGGSVVTIPTK